MAYNSTIDKATDDILIYGNTVKDGSGTSYVPLLDADGHQQIDVLTLPAIPAGTNNIGDVDVLTINGVAPAFGTGLRGATVQRVTIATDDSVPVTNAGITTIAGAVSGTEMQVDVLTMPTVTVNSHAVTNAGTFAVQVDGAALTSLQLIDDAVYASDGALSKTLGIGAVFDDVATVAITENQAGYLRMSSRRALLVEGVASGTAINVLDTNSAAALTSLQTLDNAISGAGFNITQLGGAAVPIGAGLEATAIRVTLPTNGTGIVGLAAGTNGIGKLTANSGVTIGAVEIAAAQTLATVTTLTTLTGSGVAHDGIDSGNPHKIGGKAVSTAPTDVAANDRVDGWFDLKGRQVVASKSATGTQTTVASSATNVTLLAANTARLGATIYNDSTAILYLRLQATATTSNFTTKLFADDYYEVPAGYAGIIDGIWASATGNARITELT